MILLKAETREGLRLRRDLFFIRLVYHKIEKLGKIRKLESTR